LPIPASLRAELGIEKAAPASGGCIHHCYEVRIAGERRFLKLNHARHEDAFAAEADGLRALCAAGVSAPQVLLTGAAHAHAYLLLEYLELTGKKDYAALGRMLAAGHRKAGARFGWQRDNYIGSTPQQNGGCDDWAQFWTERRLRPQLELACEKGFRFSMPSTKLLENHRPQPSLLHGDLWSGNAGFTARGPVVFDPAVYYGDREADLAMTELFGGFAPEFYDAYQASFPLVPGYEKRKHLYNLYHLLNHLNLFGSGYVAQVEATLSLLLLC
jgi:protein-ribulosamine 3-kinase